MGTPTREGKSILKPSKQRIPLSALHPTPNIEIDDETTGNFNRRRVSFTVSQIKEFIQGPEDGTVWGQSYDIDIQKSSSESEHSSGPNSTLHYDSHEISSEKELTSSTKFYIPCAENKMTSSEINEPHINNVEKIPVAVNKAKVLLQNIKGSPPLAHAPRFPDCKSKAMSKGEKNRQDSYIYFSSNDERVFSASENLADVWSKQQRLKEKRKQNINPPDEYRYILPHISTCPHNAEHGRHALKRDCKSNIVGGGLKSESSIYDSFLDLEIESKKSRLTANTSESDMSLTCRTPKANWKFCNAEADNLTKNLNTHQLCSSDINTSDMPVPLDMRVSHKKIEFDGMQSTRTQSKPDLTIFPISRLPCNQQFANESGEKSYRSGNSIKDIGTYPFNDLFRKGVVIERTNMEYEHQKIATQVRNKPTCKMSNIEGEYYTVVQSSRETSENMVGKVNTSDEDSEDDMSFTDVVPHFLQCRTEVNCSEKESQPCQQEYQSVRGLEVVEEKACIGAETDKGLSSQVVVTHILCQKEGKVYDDHVQLEKASSYEGGIYKGQRTESHDMSLTLPIYDHIYTEGYRKEIDMNHSNVPKSIDSLFVNPSSPNTWKGHPYSQDEEDVGHQTLDFKREYDSFERVNQKMHYLKERERKKPEDTHILSTSASHTFDRTSVVDKKKLCTGIVQNMSPTTNFGRIAPNPYSNNLEGTYSSMSQASIHHEVLFDFKDGSESYQDEQLESGMSLTSAFANENPCLLEPIFCTDERDEPGDELCSDADNKDSGLHHTASPILVCDNNVYHESERNALTEDESLQRSMSLTSVVRTPLICSDKSPFNKKSAGINWFREEEEITDKSISQADKIGRGGCNETDRTQTYERKSWQANKSFTFAISGREMNRDSTCAQETSSHMSFTNISPLVVVDKGKYVTNEEHISTDFNTKDEIISPTDGFDGNHENNTDKNISAKTEFPSNMSFTIAFDRFRFDNEQPRDKLSEFEFNAGQNNECAVGDKGEAELTCRSSMSLTSAFDGRDEREENTNSQEGNREKHLLTEAVFSINKAEHDQMDNSKHESKNTNVTCNDLQVNHCEDKVIFIEENSNIKSANRSPLTIVSEIGNAEVNPSVEVTTEDIPVSDCNQTVGCVPIECVNSQVNDMHNTELTRPKLLASSSSKDVLIVKENKCAVSVAKAIGTECHKRDSDKIMCSEKNASQKSSKDSDSVASESEQMISKSQVLDSEATCVIEVRPKSSAMSEKRLRKASALFLCGNNESTDVHESKAIVADVIHKSTTLKFPSCVPENGNVQTVVHENARSGDTAISATSNAADMHNCTRQKEKLEHQVKTDTISSATLCVSEQGNSAIMYLSPCTGTAIGKEHVPDNVSPHRGSFVTVPGKTQKHPSEGGESSADTTEAQQNLFAEAVSDTEEEEDIVCEQIELPTCLTPLQKDLASKLSTPLRKDTLQILKSLSGFNILDWSCNEKTVSDNESNSSVLEIDEIQDSRFLQTECEENEQLPMTFSEKSVSSKVHREITIPSQQNNDCISLRNSDILSTSQIHAADNLKAFPNSNLCSEDYLKFEEKDVCNGVLEVSEDMIEKEHNEIRQISESKHSSCQERDVSRVGSPNATDTFCHLPSQERKIEEEKQNCKNLGILKNPSFSQEPVSSTAPYIDFLGKTSGIERENEFPGSESNSTNSQDNEPSTRETLCNIEKEEYVETPSDQFAHLEAWIGSQKNNRHCWWVLEGITTSKLELSFFARTVYLIVILQDNGSVEDVSMNFKVSDKVQPIIKFMHKIIQNLIQSPGELCRTCKDVPKLIDHVSQHMEFAMTFYKDLSILEVTHNLQITESCVQFQKVSLKLKLCFKVKMDFSLWQGQGLATEAVTVQNVIGEACVEDVQRLVRGVRRGVHFLKDYVKHVGDYIRILEKSV